MSKFKVGQEVIFSKGDLKDVKGVVVTPFWRVAASDWPEVIITYNDGRESVFVAIDDVRPAEDPYEYGVTWCRGGRTGDYWEIFDGYWETLEDAQEEAKYATAVGNKGVKIMRRLKAGEPEDFE